MASQGIGSPLTGLSLPPLPGPQFRGRGEHCPGRGRPRPQGLEGAPGARAAGAPGSPGGDAALRPWRPHLTCGCGTRSLTAQRQPESGSASARIRLTIRRRATPEGDSPRLRTHHPRFPQRNARPGGLRRMPSNRPEAPLTRKKAVGGCFRRVPSPGLSHSR